MKLEKSLASNFHRKSIALERFFFQFCRNSLEVAKLSSGKLLDPFCSENFSRFIFCRQFPLCTKAKTDDDDNLNNNNNDHDSSSLLHSATKIFNSL